jgi:hypothetical protein
VRSLTLPHEICETGTWAVDNLAGRALAEAWIRQARDNDNVPALAGAIRETAKSGRWSGVEVGFAFGLASACLKRG